MKILILHRVPYFKIEYARGIPHDRHEVTYFGTDQALATLPDGLRCERVSRPGTRSAYDEARQWLTTHPRTFDRVISVSEYELLDAARLREHLGVTGPRVEQVTLTRDKVLMKQAAQDAGIRVPRFSALPDLLHPHARAPWQGRTVLKPHRGASSENVLVYDTPHQALTAVTEGRTGVAALDTGTGRADFQAEEFISGPIRHFDGLIQDGTLLLLTASQYVGTCLRYAQGQPMGSYQITCDAPTRTWVTRALAAVGIKDGSFHLEAIVSEEQELVFLEVGNRVGGADVVATVELATGVHLPSYELRILLGEPVADRLPAPPPAHAGTAGSSTPATTSPDRSSTVWTAQGHFGPVPASSPGTSYSPARGYPITSPTRPEKRFSRASSRATPPKKPGIGSSTCSTP
ncbi:acetyl-CoA carboxylase biotin carboxylase subunit family protein [Streptomyces sp. BBFR2]|uniref:ATP-grasp domain-containing protein n=1 Tax=Streptomyces sp. BBFR2 TaxID=3372854 RepID=UPI0037D9B060